MQNYKNKIHTYPFKNTVWDTYNEFDKDVDDHDVNKNNFYVLCNQIINNSKGDLSTHTNICMKLMRNLGVYSLDDKIYKPNYDRCNILYNWIYNLISKNIITYSVINKCFVEYNSYMNGISNDKRCYHFLYDKIYEPINITLLDIFDNNTPIIKETLMNQDESISTPCRKYVCKCVKIYDDMHQKYCMKGESGNEKYQNTCSRLNNFKDTYTLFFQNNHHLKDIIPSLDNIKNTYMPKCQKYVQEKPVQPSDAEERHTHPPLTKPEDENRQEPKSLITPGDENKGNHMSSTVSTTIGTVAGASSILALLYKVNTKFHLNV
ncbi:hypothetical protein PVNG_02140 [Plasmodium vivax North Korean]|uniref:Variable surface protein n=1 Tax=Plasmodium vivax North Korean TaxID=1035514 RepID=A0A0J9TWN5_PLAVI|nr:hypothetical protein PVNG_02140 [Plasmodium vivax North Korean]